MSTVASRKYSRSYQGPLLLINDLIVRKNDGEELNITFEFAVIATGSNYPRPAKFDAENKEEGVKEIIRQREAVKGAQKILIVGGGPVGIELAGEIASVYGNEKEVTLVHGEENLLSSSFPNKLRDSLAKQLKDLNVNLILGDKIDVQKSNIGDGLYFIRNLIVNFSIVNFSIVIKKNFR